MSWKDKYKKTPKRGGGRKGGRRGKRFHFRLFGFKIF